MEQVEIHNSKYIPQTRSCKYPSDVRDSRDSPDFNYHKRTPKKNQPNLLNRCIRNQMFLRSPTAEQTTSCYSCTNSYNLSKNHTCGNRAFSKHQPSRNVEMSHRDPQTHVRHSKEKRYAPTVAVVRRNYYEDELGNDEKLKYIEEESGNFTEDNVEEDGDEEADDDREETEEFLDKDYEEQEADDEIDEESDVSPQIRTVSRGEKKDALLRAHQRWMAIEQEHDSRRNRYERRMPSGQGHSSAGRYCHNIPEHDVPEPLSEEDFVPSSVPVKSVTRRVPTDYHNWAQSRSSTDRYEAATMPVPSSRRARTKPEMDRLIEQEFSKTKKCVRCGSVASKKTSPSNKSNCRFDDRSNFPSKGPIGDEPEIREQTCCGRCNVRHNVEDVGGASDILQTVSYSTKPRRSRDVKSPLYEVPEHGQMIEKISNEYARATARCLREAANVSADKNKRSVHTSHGSARLTSSRYVE